MSADSNEIELSIARNCSVAPSYSEALLMITPPPSPSCDDRVGITNIITPIATSSSNHFVPLTPPPPPNQTPPVIFYRSAPLPPRRPDDPFEGRWSFKAPPCYEEALEVSEPVDVISPSLLVQMRRSRTERDLMTTASRLLFPRRSCHNNFETHL